MYDVDLYDDKSRKLLTLLFAFIGIALALVGIMDQFVNFLYATALIIPVIAGVIMGHFFFVNKNAYTPTQSWNWWATLSITIGIIVGYITQYIYPMGIPAVQSLMVSGASYVILNRVFVRENRRVAS